jgi:hypothetical protein
MDQGEIAVLTNGEVANIIQRLEFLEEQNTQQQALIVALQTRQNVPREPKINDPEEFRGDRLQLQNFISQCQLKFAEEPSKFTNEKIKILFAGGRLRGEAYSWFQPLLTASETSTPKEFVSFKAFCDALTTIYGDPNLEITSERELRQLRQTTSVSAYIAEFARIRQYVSHNEAALRDQFYYGLRDNVKDKLANSPRPTTLVELMAAATAHDSRIHERLLERKANQPFAPALTRNSSTNSNVPPTPSRTPTPSMPIAQRPVPRVFATPPAQAPSTDGTTPMLIDSGRFGSRAISAAERERRRVENLCFYCGQPGHTLFTCPVKPPPRTFSSSFAYPVRSSSPTAETVVSVQVDPQNYPTNSSTHE